MNLLKEFEKLRIKGIPGRKFYSDKEKADFIRNENIEMAKYFMNHPRIGKDSEYTIKAYEMMSDEQVLMSEKREEKQRGKETSEFLNALEKFEEESRNSKLEIRACA